MPDGSVIEIDWATSCSPASTQILYGPLGQVSTHSIDGGVCSIGDPHFWNGVPSGDLWFVVVHGDGVRLEGSWGQTSFGERGGLLSSGECLGTTKDLSGTCP